MKSWIKTVSCTVVITLCSFSVEADSLHDPHEAKKELSKAEWFSKLHQQQEGQNILAFASEKFRSIPPGKKINMSFDEEDSDPFQLFSGKKLENPDEIRRNWINLLFGIRSWNIENEGRFPSISVHSTSVVPLPATLPLFAAGLGGILWLRRLRFSSRLQQENQDTC